MPELRTELQWFAGVMEEKLKQNDFKGGWKDEEFTYLLGRLLEEVRELYREVEEENEWDPEKIAEEAADVANIAMMIADNARSRDPGFLTTILRK